MKTEKSRLALNSEGEAFDPATGKAFDDWQPGTDEERALLALWERGMSTFRNWRGHDTGEAFSQVGTCWTPNAFLDADGTPLLKLSCEFSSDGCWLARERERDGRRCLPKGKVEGALARLLAATKPPRGVGASVEETQEAYFEIVVTATAATFDDAVVYVKALSPAIEKDATLGFAHERIA